MTTLLEDVRKLLSDPHRWTKGALARARGGPVGVLSDAADCFCVLGAVRRLSLLRNPTLGPADMPAEELKALEALQRTRPEGLGLSIEQCNDSPWTTHEDILAWLDRASK